MARPSCLYVYLLLVVLPVAAVNTGASSLDDASLVDQLLEQLALGKGSCAKVGKLARAALKPATIGLQQIAKLSETNAERDLQSWVMRQAWRRLLPDPYEFELTLQHKQDEDLTVNKAHHAMLPHDAFRSINKYAPQLFDELFGTGDVLEQWWSQAAEFGGPWYNEHPVVAEEPDPRKRVPYGIHGDDAGMHGNEQVLCLTWGPLAGMRKTTLDTRIAFSMVKVSDCVYPHIVQTMLEVFKWSLNALADGTFPDRDHNGKLFSKTHHPRRFAMAGQSLANGLRGLWGELRGDWKFLKEILHLQHHYNMGLRICHLCKVVKYGPDPQMVYSNFRRDSHHRGTLWSHAAWMAFYLAQAVVSPLLFIKGYT